MASISNEARGSDNTEESDETETSDVAVLAENFGNLRLPSPGGDNTETSDARVPVKLRDFLSCKMGEKSVLNVPGIGQVYTDALTKEGYAKAYQLLAKYLELKKDSTKFKEWLKEIRVDRFDCREDCCQAFEEWCKKHLSDNTETSDTRVPVKLQDFLSCKMGEKSVLHVPGIGQVYMDALIDKAKGHVKAYQLLAKYLELKKDSTKFKEWLKEIRVDRADCREDCCQAFEEWCKQHL